jgi:hypothetical protein
MDIAPQQFTAILRQFSSQFEPVVPHSFFSQNLNNIASLKKIRCKYFRHFNPPPVKAYKPSIGYFRLQVSFNRPKPVTAVHKKRSQLSVKQPAHQNSTERQRRSHQRSPRRCSGGDPQVNRALNATTPT